MRSEFEFADLSTDDLTVGNFICSDPSGLNTSVKEDALKLLYQYLVGDLYSFARKQSNCSTLGRGANRVDFLK